MNELIEKLWIKYSNGNHYTACSTRIELSEAIQLACKAQRNACASSVECMVSTQAINKIKTAEITEQDYE
jgi:hypothetical protein